MRLVGRNGCWCFCFSLAHGQTIDSDEAMAQDNIDDGEGNFVNQHLATLTVPSMTITVSVLIEVMEPAGIYFHGLSPGLSAWLAARSLGCRWLGQIMLCSAAPTLLLVGLLALGQASSC
jgi:hypothetical protein